MDPGRSDYRFDWRMSSAHAQTTTYQEERPQDMRTLLPFPTERMYKCGSCSSMFHMVWQLHEHVLLHTTDGWYTYNNNIRTAFPKIAGICQEIQTDTLVDASDSKKVEVVCNSTQTEELCSYFTGRDEELDCSVDPIDSSELGDSVGLGNSAGPSDNMGSGYGVRPSDCAGPGDIVEASDEDFKEAHVEVKIEKEEIEIVGDCIESDNDEILEQDDDVVDDDPYAGDTDEDINFQSHNESSSDTKDPEWNVPEKNVKKTKKKTTTSKTKTSKTYNLKQKPKKKDKSEKSIQKKSKALKALYESKSKSVGSAIVNKPLVKCKFCDKLFRNNLHMKRHCIRDHPTEKNFPCRYCDQSFVTEAEVQRHRREHNKEKNRCDICNKVLSSAQNLQDHITVHTGEKMFECKECGNYFRSRSQLSLHMSRRHNPNYDHMCENCGRVFKCRQNLQCHIKCCLDIRPFGCKICGKRYPRNTNLNVHMRKHTGEKPFVCHTCGMKFSHSNTLTKHMLVHTGERKFTCEICGQKFKAHNALKDHERIHKQEKRFTCQYCGKGFIKKCNMVTHIRQHTGETPYKCKICGQAYKQNVLLRTHMQSHKADALPASHHPQTTDEYEPELTNPPTSVPNIPVLPGVPPPPSNQLAPSYMMNHQVNPNHTMSHLQLSTLGDPRHQGSNQARNVSMHPQQPSTLQRFQGYNMAGMH